MDVLPRRLLRELDELHPQQRAAAVHDGNVVVVAGPGSGKTRTLVARVAFVLAARVSPFRGVACITYTNAAADEVRRRIKALGVPPERLVCSTVHSFCLNEVLRPFAALTRSAVPDSVLDDEEAIALLQQCFDAIGIADNARWRVGAVTSIRRTLACGEDPEAFDEREVRAARLYERRLVEGGWLDFEHMVIRALSLVREHAHVRDLLRARFPHVIVDEYQDLGGVLHALVLALRNAGVTVTAVGDADQTIFGFSGSDPKYLAELARAPDFEEHTLQVNYRSGQRIVSASEAALGHARGRRAREGAAEGSLGLVRLAGGLDEHARSATQLVEQSVLQGVPRERIAVLYPGKGVLLDQLLVAFRDAAVQHVHEREATLPRGDVVHLVRRCAALAVWHGQVRSGEIDTGVALRRLPASGVPSIDELFRELRRLAPASFTGSRLESLRGLQRCVDPTIAAAPADPASSWLEMVDEELGVLALADAHSGPGERDAIRELLAFGSHLEMQALALGGDVIGKVVLTTYHSAKGRQFHTVILPGLVEGLVPRDVKTAVGWRAPTGKALQEQRRALYVAISRAEEQVRLITGPGYHTPTGYWVSKGPSSFLADVVRHLDP